MIDSYSLEAPPPGSWTLFADHFPRALTPEYVRLYTATFGPAQAATYERYGMPLRGLVPALIGGHLYLGPVPLVGGPGALTPPKPVLWLATRLLPAFRRRRATANTVLQSRPWRDEVHVWRSELRPLWTKANLALQAVDPAVLDDEALARHLRQCRANAEEGYRTHFELHGPDLFATGLLLARGADWGLTPDELLTALVGGSPASAGADPDLDLVRTRVAEDSGPHTSLEDVRALGPEVDAALDRFLLHHSWRLITSYDLDGRCLVELPELVLTLATSPLPVAAPQTSIGALRDRVPPDDHAELQDLFDDARFTYGLRDENGGITSAWAVGLLRRAMLDAGRRLEARGQFVVAAHAVELEVDELVTLLVDGGGPSADEVAGRAAMRAETSRQQPPSQLGPPCLAPLSSPPSPNRYVSCFAPSSPLLTAATTTAPNR